MLGNLFKLQLVETGNTSFSSSSDSAITADTATSAQECTSTLGQEVEMGLTTHFQEWLSENRPDHNFLRDDISGGSFGGLINDQDCLRRQPVLFVHGNNFWKTHFFHYHFQQTFDYPKHSQQHCYPEYWDYSDR